MNTTISSIDWDAYAMHYDVLCTLRPYAQMLDTVALRTHAHGIEPMLDAGCGTGNVTHALRAHGMQHIVSIDRSPQMLARARKKFPHGQWVGADLDAQLPFDDGSFGAVVCVNALYAVADPLRTLHEFCRVLVHNGALILVTPCHGYDNGLILKEHCNSQEPDAHWQHAHSHERESALIAEAADDAQQAAHLHAIAAVNRAIAAHTRFHFFTDEEMRDVVRRAGFILDRHEMTYASQAHLIVATA